MTPRTKNRERARQFYTANGKYKLSRKEFSTIINALLDELILSLSENLYIKLPFNLGEIYVVEHKYTPRYKDGKLIGRPPISWGKTTELWNKDPEAKKAKLFVRHTETTFYIVKYTCKGSTYPNINYIGFKVNSRLKTFINKKLGFNINGN